MGWIITAAIAALVAVLLFVPIALHIRYDGASTRLWLRILFVRFLVYDSSKPQKEKKKKKENNQTTSTKKEKKDFFEIIKLVCDVGSSGLKAGKIISKHLSFYGVRVFWKIAREDPYETGVAFGTANAVAYPVLGTLANLYRVKFETIEIVPDFTAQKDAYDITLKAKMSLFNLLRAGIVFLLEMAKRAGQGSADKNRTQTNNKNTKEGALNNG